MNLSELLACVTFLDPRTYACVHPPALLVRKSVLCGQKRPVRPIASAARSFQVTHCQKQKQKTKGNNTAKKPKKKKKKIIYRNPIQNKKELKKKRNKISFFSLYAMWKQ